MKINKIYGKMDISIIIPAYNEEGNVVIIYEQISSVMNQLNKSYEIIFIDDGSTDKTFENLKRIKEKDAIVKIIKFRKNFGQTAALDAGFKHSKGEIIVSMDSDLQNDPNNIPDLLSKIRDGYDCVCGWRFNRNDSFIKRFISSGAHLTRKIIIRDNIHDSGCTLRAYRKECIQDLDLHGDMHRFIPALIIWKGFKVTEIKVKHMPRVHGKSKYNASRIVKGILDMLVVKFWTSYSSKPIHLFGTIGIFLSTVGVLIGLYLTYLKFVLGQLIGNRPLLLLSLLLMLLGFQMVVFGVLAEVLSRLYHKDSKYYYIENIF